MPPGGNAEGAAATAVPGETAETAATQRDRHLQGIVGHGRAALQKVLGCTKRIQAEAGTGGFQQAIGDGLRPRTDRRHAVGADAAVHALSRRLEIGRPIFAPICLTTNGLGATAPASLVYATRPGADSVQPT